VSSIEVVFLGQPKYFFGRLIRFFCVAALGFLVSGCFVLNFRITRPVLGRCCAVEVTPKGDCRSLCGERPISCGEAFNL
jgi:hypothetical protein